MLNYNIFFIELILITHVFIPDPVITVMDSGIKARAHTCHPFDLQTLPPCGPKLCINREALLTDPGLITHSCFVSFVDVLCQTAPV